MTGPGGNAEDREERLRVLRDAFEIPEPEQTDASARWRGASQPLATALASFYAWLFHPPLPATRAFRPPVSAGGTPPPALRLVVKNSGGWPGPLLEGGKGRDSLALAAARPAWQAAEPSESSLSLVSGAGQAMREALERGDGTASVWDGGEAPTER